MRRPGGKKDLERHASGSEPVESELRKEPGFVEPLKMSVWRESLPEALARLSPPYGEEPSRKTKATRPRKASKVRLISVRATEQGEERRLLAAGDKK
jgi:hypothetical protein